MNTPTELASRIAAAAVDRFADDNGIARAHLTTERAALSPSDVARATRALGSEAVFGG